jgi:hypothetical protein
LWIASNAVASSPGHPFYEKLERVLRDAGFDEFVESECASYYVRIPGDLEHGFRGNVNADSGGS